MDELKKFIKHPTASIYWHILDEGIVDCPNYGKVLAEVMEQPNFMTQYEPENLDEAFAMFIFPSRQAKGDWNPDDRINGYIQNGILVEIAKKILEFTK